MAAFAALLERDGRPPDPTSIESLRAALHPFGSNVHIQRSGPLHTFTAAADVEPPPATAISPAGMSAVGVLRWTARAELQTELGGPGPGPDPKPSPSPSPNPSDVELLLEAYARWGSGLLEHVQGEFAFVLWDAERRLLLAATDHFGARPLFHSQAGGRLLLSNSVPALRDSGLCDTSLDENAAGDFLAVGFSIDPSATLYQGIRRLPPGHRLLAQGSTIRVEPYWRLPDREPLLLYRRQAEYAERLRELVLRSTADRIPASGKIGILLSGGMDSTSVAAGICQALGREAAAERMDGYTFTSRTVREEEGRYAGLVARHLGIRHHKLEVEDALGHAGTAVGNVRPPQPGVDGTSFAGTQPARELAASGGTIFSGQGGDALFRPTRRDLPRIVQGNSWLAPFATARYAFLFGGLPATGARRFVAGRLRRGGAEVAPLWLNPDFVCRTGLTERVTGYFSSLRQDAGGLIGPFWTNLLTLGVSSQTGLSFEPSHPFFDIRVLRFALRLPDPLLRGKRVLRLAMEPFLPREILQRPKAPLGGVMVNDQIDTQRVDRQLRLLMQTGSYVAHYFDSEVLRRCILATQPETALGLYRTEALLTWAAAQS